VKRISIVLFAVFLVVLTHTNGQSQNVITFADSFSQGNANGWIWKTGDWKFADSIVSTGNDIGHHLLLLPEYYFYDFTFQADVLKDTDNLNPEHPGLVFRWVNDTMNYVFRINGFGTESWIQLMQDMDFGDRHAEYIASAPWYTPENRYRMYEGVWYTMKVHAEGNHIQCKVWRKSDPEPPEWNLDVFDTLYSKGEIGLEYYSGTHQFDNVIVTGTASLNAPLLALTAVPENGQIRLHWEKGNRADIVRYLIYGDTVPHPTTLIDSATGGINDTMKTFRGLTNGTAYYFRILEVDSQGLQGGWSKEAVAIPDPFVDSLTTGWNIVSVPFLVPDYRKTVILPLAATDAYMYTGGAFVPRDTLANGYGYWVRLESSRFLSLNGTPLHQDTISVVEGWNIIGSITTPVPAAQIASGSEGMETSPFFGYDGVYRISDTIQPGKGYWVKTNQAGTLILASSPGAAQRIRIIPTNELPPAPPGVKTGIAADKPRQFVLAQNFPNPFNPTTTIGYEVPEKQRVKLAVYNVLGQLVATLVDEERSAGRYSVTWDAGRLPSGVYFYRMEAGSFTETKKMAVVK